VAHRDAAPEVTKDPDPAAVVTVPVCGQTTSATVV
jgi:hypothetical protein